MPQTVSVAATRSRGSGLRRRSTRSTAAASLRSCASLQQESQRGRTAQSNAETLAAQFFAGEVYAQLAVGKSLDQAVTLARKRLLTEKLPDWANYILYGDGHFRLITESPRNQ